MRICIVGGIYDKPPNYRHLHRHTPETVLSDALEEQGHTVARLGHKEFRSRRHYDLVHVHHLGVAAIRMMMETRRIPFVFTGHDLRVLNGTPTPAWWCHYYIAVCRSADGLVALSEREATYLRGGIRYGGRVAVIPNGVRSDVFRRTCETSHIGIRILCVAQLIRLKGIDVLIRALAGLPASVSVRLVYQNALLEPDLRRLAKECGVGDRVMFVGFLSPAELAGEYGEADFCVQPSRTESLPSAVIESLLCGTPVVGTDVGAIPEIVGSFGEICPPGDVAALRAAMERMLCRLPVPDSERNAARGQAERTYDVRAMATAHMTFYRDLVAGIPRHQSLSQRVVNRALGTAYLVGARARGGAQRP